MYRKVPTKIVFIGVYGSFGQFGHLLLSKSPKTVPKNLKYSTDQDGDKSLKIFKEKIIQEFLGYLAASAENCFNAFLEAPYNNI